MRYSRIGVTQVGLASIISTFAPTSSILGFSKNSTGTNPKASFSPEVASLARASALAFYSRGICLIEPRSNADISTFTFTR